jgi:hypothetical protein
MAQEVTVGALPTFYNGGFAGEAGTLRVTSFSYFKYTPSRVYASHTKSAGSFISVDHFVKKIRSGIAFTAGVERERRWTDINSMILAISPKLSFGGKYTFAPFADFSFKRYKIRYDGLVRDTVDFDSHYDVDDFAIRTGFLVNSSRAYAGITADIYQYWKSTLGVSADRSFTNMRYTFQAGYTFQRIPDAKFSFTPQLVINYSRNDFYDFQKAEISKIRYITLMDINLMFRYDRYMAGLCSNGLLLGYQRNRFRLSVTNIYSNRDRVGTMKSISDRTYFRTRPFVFDGPQTYYGSISLRYTFKKDTPEKMPGFKM